MNINYHNNNIVEAEILADGSEIISVACARCGNQWQLEDGDIALAPYPHFECPSCGEWIPLF